MFFSAIVGLADIGARRSPFLVFVPPLTPFSVVKKDGNGCFLCVPVWFVVDVFLFRIRLLPPTGTVMRGRYALFPFPAPCSLPS